MITSARPLVGGEVQGKGDRHRVDRVGQRQRSDEHGDLEHMAIVIAGPAIRMGGSPHSPGASRA
jgi:hypothetical protein